MSGVPLFGRKKDKSSGILKNYERVVEEGFEAAKRGDEDKAILTFRKLLRWVTEDYNKIVKLSEEEKAKLSELLTDVGEEMIRLKEFDIAIKILEKAKTINPKNFRAWMDIGKDLLQRNRQVPYALVCLREAAKLEPENVDAHLLLGDAYRVQGQLDKALAAYQKALKVDPDNEDALQKVLKIQPENLEVLERYIKILEMKGNKEDLLKAYNRIVSITGDIEYLERGLQLDPENKGLLMNKAKLLLKNDEVDEAKKIVKMLSEKYPDDPDIQMLYDELMPTHNMEEEVKEEIAPVEVSDLFGDISLGETPDISFEEEGSLQIEGDEEEGNEEKSENAEEEERKNEEKVLPKVAEETPIETAKESAPVAIEEKNEEFKEETISETSEPAPVKEEKLPYEEVISSAKENKEELIEVPEDMVTVPPEDMFMELYGLKKLDEAAELLSGMEDEEIMRLIGENVDVLKFVYEQLKNSGRKEVAMKFIEKISEIEPSEDNLVEKADMMIELGKLEEAEKLLNEIVKKNMKNANALYLKSRIMSVKGNDMGARNFLMMAIKFNPELKNRAKDDPHLEKYRDNDWFKKLVS